MKLSIVVTNYDTADHLAKCLDSLHRFAPAFPHEVLVVDNHSQDGSAGMVRAHYPHYRLLVLPENRGFAHASNAAARRCSGDLILFLNGDMEATRGALERLVRYLEEHPGVGIIGPRLVNPRGNLQISWGRFPSLRNEIVRKLLHSRVAGALKLRALLAWALLPGRDCDWVSGAGLMGRREALSLQEGEKIFDEQFFLYFEDIDLCHRVKREGRGVQYVSDVTFVHAGGGSARKHPISAMLAYRESQLRFCQKHFGKRSCFALRTYLECKAICGIALYGLKAIWAGARGKYPASTLARVAAFRKVRSLCRSTAASAMVSKATDAPST